MYCNIVGVTLTVEPYEGVRSNVISITMGGGEYQISRKNYYMTLEWPLK